MTMTAAARRFGPAIEAMHVFLRWSGPAVEGFPRGFKFTLGDRILATAMDVLERLIEATYERERQKPLNAANLGVEKLRHLFRLALDLHCLDARRYEHAARQLDDLGRMIGSWKNRASPVTPAMREATML
jgi:hypothetical protein